jgi:hypothetical protein
LLLQRAEFRFIGTSSTKSKYQRKEPTENNFVLNLGLLHFSSPSRFRTKCPLYVDGHPLLRFEIVNIKFTNKKFKDFFQKNGATL